MLVFYRQYLEGADLADTQSISKFNEGFRFFLCPIDIFSKYTWLVPLKINITITKYYNY